MAPRYYDIILFQSMAFVLSRQCIGPLKPSKMALNLSQTHHNKSSVTFAGVSSTQSSDTGCNGARKLPILLFDIMDTVVRDPFFDDVPAFFRMTFEELIESKHPTTWMEFEKGMIDEARAIHVVESMLYLRFIPLDWRSPLGKLVMELGEAEELTLSSLCTMELTSDGDIRLIMMRDYLKHELRELARIFFKDGRPFDLEGLKDCMKRGYLYKEGVEELLQALKENNYEMHAFTNYPIWYKLIEEKLRISRYLEWTFCSCKSGKRKPDHDFFLEVLEHLKVEPENCVFIDDSLKNVEGAIEVGIVGLHFKNADLLFHHLSQMGIHIPPPQPCQTQDFSNYAEADNCS